MKIEANQYYRTRNGNIAFVAAIAPEQCQDTAYRVLGWTVDSTETWDLEGFWNGPNVEGRLDLVEHLPDCIGFDWVPSQPIKIEHGKKYKLSNGEIVGPLTHLPSSNDYPWMCWDTQRWWRKTVRGPS